MSNLINFALRKGASFLTRHSLPCFRLTVPYVVNKTPVSGAIKNYSTRAAPFDVSTSVPKDLILFKYENPKFYKMLNFFGICQFVFWTYLSHFAFTTLKDAPVVEKPEEELKWFQRINLGDNKYRNGITACCFLIGYGILFAVWMFTLRSVRFLILRKGGQSISFVTYGPFNRNRIMTVPLKCISAQESREMARVQLPIKVKDRTLYYVLDMRGEFRNPQLFDYTAGLKRRI
ncbi:transmembrane protein 223 [Drosophila pseudoobscura]|uniref:Transmembrane protein 223 n=1 Tax=Drosophila pseudoobscura pseudoobscura TaxID=46245 RepID=A0A6I8UVX8_DROPS|nr:transmembrane protein 223 [Drosophila pseudoobscura]